MSKHYEKRGKHRERSEERPVKKSAISAQECIGELSVNIQGFGFVRMDGGDSVFVPPGYLGGAVTGDTVRVVLDPAGDPARPVAHVKRILERKFRFLVGCMVPLRGGGWGVRPLRHELPGLLRIAPESLRKLPEGPREGNWCRCEFPFPEEDFPAETLPDVTLLECYAACGEVSSDLDAIVAEYNIPAPYTEEDEKDAEALQPVKVRRLDCTKDTAVTIDPVDARDYDDALSLGKSPRPGTVVVGVHIADVASYVRPGSALDRQARQRCFTSYLPGRTLPMLPKALANRQCSLQSGQERLAHSVFICFDEHTGEILSWQRRHTVINVTQRLCYEQVQSYLDGGEFEASQEVKELVSKLAGVSRLLRHRRMTRERFLPMGMPEIRVVCSEHPSQIFGVQQSEDNPSHQLVEEFMLAANECIAMELQRLRLPGLYRNHQAPDPEKLQEFAENATIMMGERVKSLSTRGAIVRFLKHAAESPLRDVLYMAFLRHLPRADYGVDPMGHFGLGKENYCHFTSPIRRYADLLVHQQLLSHDLRRKTYSVEAVQDLAMLCSAKEYQCDQAEFAASDRMKIRYLGMKRQEDPTLLLTGEICKITKSGCQVYLPDYGLMAYVNELPHSWRFDSLKIQWTNRDGDTLRMAQKRLFEMVAADPIRGELILAPAAKRESDAKPRRNK